MQRRSVLAALGAAASALAGCGFGDAGDASTGDRVEETLTPAPVPTDEPASEDGPPADLSRLGVDDASALARRHSEALSAGPHGFVREAAVLEDDAAIQRVSVRVAAAADAAAYHYVFDAEDTERYPVAPAEPYFEVWDDGTTYHRVGHDDADEADGATYHVTEGRAVDRPLRVTVDRERVAALFGALRRVDITRAGTAAAADHGDHWVVDGTGLRGGRDVNPSRFRAISDPSDARLEARVYNEPTYVLEYDLELEANVDGRAVQVEAAVDYERPREPPAEPAWVETAREQAEQSPD